MEPDFSIDDFGYGWITNMEQSSDFIARHSSGSKGANLAYLSVVESRPAMTNTASTSLRSGLPTCATLANHVLHVIRLRSAKQMLWVYTQWIVATMKYLKSRRNWAADEHVSKSVNQNMFTLAVNSSASGIAARLDGWPSPYQTLAFPTGAAPKLLHKLLVGNYVHKSVILPRFAVA